MICFFWAARRFASAASLRFSFASIRLSVRIAVRATARLKSGIGGTGLALADAGLTGAAGVGVASREAGCGGAGRRRDRQRRQHRGGDRDRGGVRAAQGRRCGGAVVAPLARDQLEDLLGRGRRHLRQVGEEHAQGHDRGMQQGREDIRLR